MKRTLGIFMVGLLAIVFALGDMPLYACVKQGSLHILKSCCDQKVEVVVKKDCCGSEKATEKTKGPVLKEICCNSIDHQLTMPYTANGDLKLIISQETDSGSYIAFYESALVNLISPELGGNKSPPGWAWTKRPSTTPLFILHNSYLC
ncbi:hypothetical protein PQO01_05290 [Lentisphaera marina]|uniref:hypothetical protein n=1 Tax=Lentisphaera marina TaxID=1111041 RepID=UPI002365AF10|nr:hypothetical protein [Lentisphaera marina]MDD7984360.1 hypothetical protein [Lentisphaera marina]